MRWRRAAFIGALSLVLGGATTAPGPWEVLRLLKPPANRPTCLLTISDQATQKSNPTRWSIRDDPDELVLIENSIGIGDATIESFTITIDGQALGDYAIKERVYSPENVPSVVKYVSALALVPDPADRERIVLAIRPNSTIRIERRGTTLDTTIGGDAAAKFDACRRDLRTP